MSAPTTSSPSRSERPASGPAPTLGRMSLRSVVGGRQAQPVRVLLYGVEGIGKSTFAAAAPMPIFIGAEDGTAHLDVQRFQNPEKWQDVLDAVRALTVEKHEYQTLVIDTLDWAEPLLWRKVCADGKVESIEDLGYGRGYTAALDGWRVLLAGIEELRRVKRMHVVFLAHSWIKPFKDPEGPGYDRYEMKIHAKAGGLMKEWCDCVLFANYETFAQTDAKTKRVRGVDTGARLFYTQRRAAYDAKNRYDLPESLPLSWEDFFAAVQARQPGDPVVLGAAISAKLPQLGKADAEKAQAALVRAGQDAAKLAQLNDWVNAKIGAIEANGAAKGDV